MYLSDRLLYVSSEFGLLFCYGVEIHAGVTTMMCKDLNGRVRMYKAYTTLGRKLEFFHNKLSYNDKLIGEITAKSITIKI